MSVLMSSGPIGFITQLPPTTRALSATLVALSLLIQIMRMTLSPMDLKSVFKGSVDDSLAFPWLVVVPGSAVWYPWTLLTAGLTEVGIVELIFSLITLTLSGRYLERVYGSIEFLKFCVVTIVVSNVICVGVNVLEHFVLGDSGTFLYGMSYHGLMALQTGFLVAFTQLIPEHQVQLFGLFKVRVKKLPMAYVGFSNVMCLVGYQSPFILIQMGWLVSWFWLRFCKMSEGGEFRGDRSETFAFAGWFPPFVQGPIKKISDIVFNLAVSVGVVRPWSGDLETGTGSYSSVPGGARAEAERRRAMALKALDQRLASNKPGAPIPSQGSTPASSNVAPTATGPMGGAPTLAGDAMFDSGADHGAKKEKE